ncbi:hypothetical protein E1211_07505 [Micromonospora sp. 15K316]|uniref:hypothetical protein n=1 Tax=Micromonospora sp. 15K316 TaxID=2530376 RepID=UPI00104CEFF9|nr:hypothetical protein [Micromonospora sp. 15K316]TDC38272.1 hypothetical protein E1211_07505 [Micromonospora sp. 15K316]
MVLRSVTVTVHFNPDRSMRLVVAGPDGPVDAGVARRSADLGRLAQAAATAEYGPGPIEVAVLVDRPPWLEEGMIVRPDASVADPTEKSTHPFAQIVGFLPVGGVLVVHPESGAAVYAPEDLVVCDPGSIGSDIVEAIVGRTGVAAA